MGLERRSSIRACRPNILLTYLTLPESETTSMAKDDGGSVDDVDDKAPGFAPKEPTDDRELGDWKSRYNEPAAQQAIKFEARYICCVLLLLIGAITAIGLASVDLFGLKIAIFLDPLAPYALAFLGGALGGSLFTMKWLYHSVAKNLWNIDRRLWRIFTPALSGGASFALVLLCSSGVIPVFGPDIVQTKVGALGVSVFLGYFSDRAFSALERFAEQNLGSNERR